MPNFQPNPEIIRSQKQDLFEMTPSEDQISEGLQKQSPKNLRDRLSEVLVQLR